MRVLTNYRPPHIEKIGIPLFCDKFGGEEGNFEKEVGVIKLL